MEKLIDILRRALNEDLEIGWLYLPCKKCWSLDTLGIILDIDEMGDDELNSDGEPLIAKKNDLADTLDNQIIEDVVRSFRCIEALPSDDGLLEAFVYYYKYDAFLPRRGFEPLPIEERTKMSDREFYDALGNESEHIKCKHEGCSRGKVNLSLFCRIHDFEMIKRKPCPFNH